MRRIEGEKRNAIEAKLAVVTDADWNTTVRKKLLRVVEQAGGETTELGTDLKSIFNAEDAKRPRGI